MKNVGVSLLIFVFVEVIWCEGCWKEEREALLGLNSLSEFALSWLWEGTDCCEWGRVECNSSTGRVAKLNLQGLRYLSYANLVVFKDLKSLNLGGIYGILDCADSEGYSPTHFDLHHDLFSESET